MTQTCANSAAAVAAVVLCLAAACSCGEGGGRRVRYPVFAGQWYTGDPTRLREQMDHFLAAGASKAKVSGKPIALIAPHAGYAYSGRCAGVAFATVKGQSYKRVVVLAVNHRGPAFRGGSILKVDAYKTPLGEIPLDRKACALLLRSKHFASRPSAHRQEHSLEVELPFLQVALGSFHLVPVVVGQLSSEDFAPMAAELGKVVDDDTLVVVSCDFTHYGQGFRYTPFRSDVRKNIEKLDRGAVDFIAKGDAQGFWGYVRRTGATICGRCPVAVLLTLLPEKATGQLLNYYTSGDATGDYRQSVSYAAIAFTAPGQWGKPKADLSAADATPATKAPEPHEPAKAPDPPSDAGVSAAGQKKLLEIARNSLVAVTAGKPMPELELDEPELQGKYGVFVTLYKQGKLRGCIGNFRPQTPLYRTVAAQTQMSARRDHRFRPVQASEVKEIDIEISVLLPEKRIDAPLAWEFGKHGIIVRRGRRQATFLPQVADHFDSKEQMLSACCRKAGLPMYIWRDPATTVLVYRAQVFGEKPKKRSQ